LKEVEIKALNSHRGPLVLFERSAASSWHASNRSFSPWG
jgi:hypothetical protein